MLDVVVSVSDALGTVSTDELLVDLTLEFVLVVDGLAVTVIEEVDSVELDAEEFDRDKFVCLRDARISEIDPEFVPVDEFELLLLRRGELTPMVNLDDSFSSFGFSVIAFSPPANCCMRP